MVNQCAEVTGALRKQHSLYTTMKEADFSSPEGGNGNDCVMSYCMEQRRSIWVPQNWTWWALFYIGLISESLLTISSTLIATLLLVECALKVEDAMLGFHEDIVLDRSQNMVLFRLLATGTVCMGRLLARVIWFAALNGIQFRKLFS